MYRYCETTVDFCVHSIVLILSKQSNLIGVFPSLCKEIAASCCGLLRHNEVRLLSGGRVLKRTYLLQEEIVVLLNEQDHVPWAKKFR